MGLHGGSLTLLTVGLALVAVVAGPAGQARADCAADPEQLLLRAPHVVAGTVVDTQTGFARLRVSEVWRGGRVAPLLWVQTAQAPPSFPFSLFEGSASSSDVQLGRGDRLVLATDEQFRTGLCQVFPADDAALPALRPRAVAAPAPGGSRGADRPVGAGKVIGWSLAALALLSLLTVGLRRPRPAGGGGRPEPSGGSAPDVAPGG
jgi:hypothetical protein